MKSHQGYLLTILLLAVLLRFIAIGDRTLWYDEAFAVLFSEKGLDAMLYGTITPVDGGAADVHPLLYYTLLNGWMNLVGQSPVAVRSLSLILGVATVFVIYLLASELFDQKTGLIAALITAVAPFHIQYSQEARMYALLGLLLTSATLFYVYGWKRKRLGYWIAFGVLAALAMYAQQLAAFYLFTLGLQPIILRRFEKFIPVVLSGVLAMIIYAPWLVNLPSQLGKIGSYYWIPIPSLVQPLVTLWSFLFVDLPVINPFIATISVTTLVLVLVFFLLRVMSTLGDKREKSSHDSLLMILSLAFLPIMLMWLISQWRPVYLTRALLPSGLIFYIAVGWLLSRGKLPRFITILILIPWGITIVAGLLMQYTWQVFPRSPFDYAANEIVRELQEGDQIVHANKLSMLPMFYYDRDLPHSFIKDIPGSGEDTLALPTQEVLKLFADDCIGEAAKGSQRVWYVIFDRQLDEYAAAKIPLPDIVWLDEHYKLIETRSFNDLRVYRYENPDEVAKSAVCNER